MKRFVAVVMMFVCLAFSMALVGCGQTKDKEPEPYTKMMKSIEDENIDHAYEFADFVIQDFSDSKYVYNAYLIKNMVLCSKMELETFKLDFLTQGTDNLSTYLVDQNDLDDLEAYIKKSIEQSKKLGEPFDETLEYLLDHYDDAEKVKLIFSEEGKNNVFYAENDMQALSFLSSVGYPVPTETEMYGNDQENIVKLFNTIKTGNGASEGFTYPGYFYIAATMCSNDDLVKKVCNKIIEITENDKYNVYRLDAEKYLKSLKN